MYLHTYVVVFIPNTPVSLYQFYVILKYVKNQKIYKVHVYIKQDFEKCINPQICSKFVDLKLNNLDIIKDDMQSLRLIKTNTIYFG